MSICSVRKEANLLCRATTRDERSMNYDKLLGVSCPEHGWVPTPAYTVRRDRILRHIKSLPTGRIIEFGCGAGGILYDLAQMGFQCEAVELSETARETARYINAGFDNVRIDERITDETPARYDYVLAFEVLEHIEDDQAALDSWVSLLKPGGRIVLSVPAHPSRWNSSDVWAGHYRRYTASGLSQLLEDAGLKIEQIEYYGFPLTNVTEPIRARVHRKKLEREKEHDKLQASMRSGIERPLETRLFPILASWPGRIVMRTMFVLQHVFRRLPLGNGLLITAVHRRVDQIHAHINRNWMG